MANDLSAQGDFTPIGNAGESGSDWTAVTGWQLVITTNTVGSSTVACNGLYFQWGYGPSSFGGTGYDYRATYYDANTGTESNGTPEQEFNTQFGYLASLAAPFFLRQAAQVNGFYSNDPQVTHVRIYRRGGIYPNNWLNIDQIPNVINAVARFNPFSYKDVIPDAALAQAPGLILDNDPPVTSSLEDPIATTLSLPTSSPGSSLYSAFVPQLISVAQASAVFVANQTVVIGNAVNLEEIQVITGGTGSFTGILRLQHNAGEPVYAFSTPRTPCDQCAFAYGQVWLAGDKNNPNFLYYSKPGYPENFGPEDYLEVGSSSDIINAVVNWRGTLYVGTQLSWYVITGGATPGWQPTGSIHGIVANKGWTQAEGGIWYQAADGQRLFRGSEGTYMTLEVEWLYRLPSATQVTPIPLVDTTQLSQVVMAFWNNDVYLSYVSLNNSGQRYRLIYNTSYNRFRDDDIPATAMLWEQDTNLLLTAKQLGTSANYVIVQEGVGDSDDGGWAGTQLTTLPIALDIQTPYRGSSHFPNQFNVLETDASTASQDMATTLLFDTEPPVSLVLDTFNTEGVRQKNQLQINDGDGQQAYSMSIQHTMNVFNAPVLYQENIYVAVLAGYRTSRDTYWIKFGTDASKLVKQGYFDYQSTAPIIYNLYADGSDVPYYTFTLPAAPNRAVVRVRFGQNDGVNSAVILRTFRMIGTSTAPYQDWANPRVEFKAVAEGASYAIGELNP